MKYALIFWVLTFFVAMSEINAQNAPIALWESGAPNANGKEAIDTPTLTPFLAA